MRWVMNVIIGFTGIFLRSYWGEVGCSCYLTVAFTLKELQVMHKHPDFHRTLFARIEMIVSGL
jgi:hypothetical protein